LAKIFIFVPMFIKNHINAVITLAMVLTIFACEEKDKQSVAADYVITARVENGNAFNSAIGEVRSVAGDDYFQLPNQISGAYVNGGFTITLPGTFDAKSLKRVREGFDPWIKVSDTNARYFRFSNLAGYDRNGSHIGNFALHDVSTVKLVKFDGGSELDGIEYRGSYWYVDRDVTISGGGDDGYSCNLVFKKGWNIVYDICYLPPCNGGPTTTLPSNKIKWQLDRSKYYNDAFKTRFAKGTLGASGKSRPIEMSFENVSNTGDLYFISGKSKTNVATDAFNGTLKISSQVAGGSCKSGEFEIKGSYELDEKKSKTSGSFKGTFTACEKSGRLSKASFKGNWVKDANGNKTPCDFGI
jgi:hypothetical protein